MRYHIRVKRLKEVRAGLRRTKETLSNFTPFLRPRRGGLLLALVVLLLETVMSLAQPWPLALTIDYVLTDKKELPEACPTCWPTRRCFWPG